MNRKAFITFAFCVVAIILPQAFTQNVTTAAPPTTQQSTTRAPITQTPPTTVGPTSTSRTFRTTSRGTTLIPGCPVRCSRQGPSLCASNRFGICQKFANTCDLRRVNCRLNPYNRYTVVCPMRCSKDMRIGERRRCIQSCPRRPIRCKTPPPKSQSQICLRRRSGNSCRLVASRCEMHRLNCQWPRGAWIEDSRRLCRGMKTGDEPQRCKQRN